MIRSEPRRRELFAREYVLDRNGAQAAIRAGYSAGSAKVTASRLLTDANVQKMIKTLEEKAAKAAELSAEEVKRSLARALRFDARKLYNADGSLKLVTELDDDVALELEGIEIEEITVGTGKDRRVIGKTTKVRHPKKSVAREQAMKHFGLFKKDNEQTPNPLKELMDHLNANGKRGLI